MSDTEKNTILARSFGENTILTIVNNNPEDTERHIVCAKVGDLVECAWFLREHTSSPAMTQPNELLHEYTLEYIEPELKCVFADSVEFECDACKSIFGVGPALNTEKA